MFTEQLIVNFPAKNTSSDTSKTAKKLDAHKTNRSTSNHCHGAVARSPRQVRRNARERGRKARLNAAFQVLRSMVPKTVESSQERKLTQVEILRLAKNYICSLTSILQTCNEDARTSYQDSETSCDNILHG